MILGKQSLRAAISAGTIKLHDDQGDTLPEWEPILRGEVGAQDPIALQPASIDLHFGNEWMVPLPTSIRDTAKTDRRGRGKDGFHREWFTDAKLQVQYQRTVSDYFDIPAHGFVLVRTREVIGLPEDLQGFVDGRSSVGRLGLIIETAGVVDAGFYGSITLELYNVLPNPLRVYAGMRGCQITFEEIRGSTEGGYQSTKYQGQVNTTGTMLYRDFEA